MPWSEAAAWALAAAVGSASLTLLSIRYARRRGLLDAPGERRSHAQATPRGGGIAIVAMCLAAMLLLALRAEQPAGWWLAIAGLLLVAGIGWWDDHRPLPAWPRLLAHLLAAAMLALAAWHWSGDWRLVLLAFLTTPVMVNAWNFMDGIDTLATGQALLCAGAVALLGATAALAPALVLAGACAGFLLFNRPPARIFLGDVGSGALGYQLVVLALLALPALPARAWPLLLLPPMAMLMDASATLLWRMRQRHRWWQPHVQHAYQRWSRRIGHGRVSLAYSGWTAGVIGVMLCTRRADLAWVVAVVLAAAVASGLAWWQVFSPGRGHPREGIN